MLVDHLAVGTRSLQDYRGIAAGRGRAVFNGKVVVHEGAQQSQARQSSRNLLLTPGAEIDTKPELEIYADDVQCSHGATTGQLDPDGAVLPALARPVGERGAQRADAGLRRRRAVAHGPRAVSRHSFATCSTRASRRLPGGPAVSAARPAAAPAAAPPAPDGRSTSPPSARDFPVLAREVNGQPLCYLDNAASSQQPARR